MKNSPQQLLGVTLVLSGHDQQFPSFYAIKMFHYSLTQWTHIGLQAAHLEFWIHFIIRKIVENFHTYWYQLEFEKKDCTKLYCSSQRSGQKDFLCSLIVIWSRIYRTTFSTLILCLIKCFHANIFNSFLHKHSNDVYYFMILQFDFLSLRHFA